MGRIQSSIGLITGTDIVGTVDQLMRLNAQPRDRLVNRTQTLLAEQGALAELTASVIGVQLSSRTLSSLATFRSKAATSDNADALSVASGTRSQTGPHVVRTLQTAATHRVSTSLRFDSTDNPLGLSGSIELAGDGFVDQSMKLSEFNNGRGVQAGTIRITDRSGASSQVDLSDARTIDDVLSAINDADVGVRATTDGGAIRLIDETDATDSNLRVEQLGNAETAADLGLHGIDVAAGSATGGDLTFNVDGSTSLSQLRQNRGVRFADGSDLKISFRDGGELEVDFATLTDSTTDPTLENVAAFLNTLDPAKLSATITADGLVLEDLTAGDGGFSIDDLGGLTVADLGLDGPPVDGKITAAFSTQTLRGTTLDRLDGGSGIGPLGTLDITLSDGTTGSVDLSGAATTAEVVDAIAAAGLDLIARIDDAGTGLRLRDVSGGQGDFTIGSADDTAARLGIEAGGDDSIIVGSNLNRRLIDESSLLSSFNRGAGVDSGSFTITDSDGNLSAINLKAEGIKTVGALINRINDLGIGVTAAINDAGDSLSIVDTAGGTGTLTIVDNGEGTAAADLGIAGSATTQTVGGSEQSAVVGSQRDRIGIDAGDSLATIVEKINDASRYAAASIRTNDDGTYSLQFSSTQAGAAGRFGVRTIGFDLATRTESVAQDALIAVSTDGGIERFLSSSDGVFELDATTDSSTITAATKLTDIASGLTGGSLKITDSDGNVSGLNLTTGEIETVGQLIDSINGLGLGVTARIGADGEIAIIDTAGGDGSLTIEDVGNSGAATQLNLAGEASETVVDGETLIAVVGGRVDDGEAATGTVLTLKQLAADPIKIGVSDNVEAIVTAANTFVDQYNRMVDKLESLTVFNAETEEVGLLFGSSEAIRVSGGYQRLLSGSVNAAGEFRSVGQVGIRFTDDGKLNLDREKLGEAIEENRDAVEAFFTTADTGLAARVDAFSERLAGVDNSLLLNRTESIGVQVERNNRQVESLNDRLEAQRERLLNQFYATEIAISRIQSNQSAISSIQPIRLNNDDN